jgi:hypothetical protein
MEQTLLQVVKSVDMKDEGDVSFSVSLQLRENEFLICVQVFNNILYLRESVI